MSFPITRPRRMRATEAIRRMVRETNISPDDLIYPLFITHGLDAKVEIASMPGTYRFSVDTLANEVKEIKSLGILAVLLFGLPAQKDDRASEAYDSEGIVQRAVRKIKQAVPDMVVITDVCLCEYMSHGHCGVVQKDKVLNDETLELLVRTAISHADAGADMVAPSDMMDGRVGAIREALDESHFTDVAIMSYSAKYASAFYGPFREAADSAPGFGDRRNYQMDPANRREALMEIMLDVEEGADIIMVKPALAYLDIISDARGSVDLPIAAYNVSGEYSMVKAAAANGWIDEQQIVMELLTSIKRAGADMIISYHAKDAARWLVQR